jgi:hypothetical protein
MRVERLAVTSLGVRDGRGSQRSLGKKGRTWPLIPVDVQDGGLTEEQVLCAGMYSCYRRPRGNERQEVNRRERRR